MPIGLVFVGGVLVAITGVIASLALGRHKTVRVPHIR
jgi:hypothetical protein